MVLVGCIYRGSWCFGMISAAILLCAGGCSTDAWVFRPRDASAAPTDTLADTESDRASTDTVEVSDVAIDHIEIDGGQADAEEPAKDVVAAFEDRQMADDNQMDFDRPEAQDVPVAVDSPLMSDMPISSDRPTVSGPRLISASFMTGSLPSNSGTLRLQHAGFDVGHRSCAGSLCLSGGFFR